MMKKLSLFFLLLPLWGLSPAWAQSVQLIDENFTSGEVTFSVDVGVATSTWVLVEYTTDPSPTSAIMSRATFTDESINPPSAGALAAEGRGFLLESSATITAKLKDVSGRFSWCGYAFGDPPNAKLTPDGSYSLHGTPPFIVNGDTLAAGVRTFGPGTCITSITDFTYNPAGNPSLPAVTVNASETEVCAGAEVTFTAMASGGTTTAMTYTWNVAGTTPSISSNTYSQILSTAGKATYTVRVTNVNGCTSTASGTVTVNAVPAVTAVSSSVCYDTPATLTASATNATTPATYTWEIDGAATTTDRNTYPVPASIAPVTYTVQITNATGCTSTVSNAGTITWYEEFTPGAITTDEQTICSGEDVNTIASSSAASGGNTVITYQWRRISTNSTTITTNAPDYTPTAYNTTIGAATFTRWARDGQCSGFIQSAGSYVLTVNPRPVPFNASSVSICAGNTATFSAEVAAGAIIDWYDELTGGNMVSPNTWSYTPGSPLTVTTTYYVEASNTTTGCVSIPRLPVTTTVEPLPVILVDGMPGSACVGDDLNVQASGARAGSSYCFSSYVDGIGNSDCEYHASNTYSVTVPPTGTMTIRARAMTPAGCVDSVLVYLPDMSSPDCINSAGVIATSSTIAILGPYPPRLDENKPKSLAPAVTAGATTYEWRRTGTSSAILDNSNVETYIITEDEDALYTAGTYYYNRYIRDGNPNNSVGLRADGTYTLVVVAPPECHSGTTTWWKMNTDVIWSGFISKNLVGQPGVSNVRNCTLSGNTYYAVHTNQRSAFISAACVTPWRGILDADLASVDNTWFGSVGWELCDDNSCPADPITECRQWGAQTCLVTYNMNSISRGGCNYASQRWHPVRCVADYKY
jgi:hypothetical protein